MARERYMTDVFETMPRLVPGAVNGYLLGGDASGNASWIAPGSVGQNVPAARVANVAGTSITSATDTVIPWATKTTDTDNMWASGANTKLTINTPGFYTLTTNIGMATSATGSRQVWFRLNGSTLIEIANCKASDDATNNGCLNLVAGRQFSAGDFVEVLVRQTSGGALLLASGAEYNTFTAVFTGGAGAIFSNTPYVRATNSAAPSTTSGTTLFPAFATESDDTDSMHDTVTNNGRLIVNTPGVYVVVGQALFPANSGGSRQAFLRLNGATIFAGSNSKATDDAAEGGQVQVVGVRRFNAQDFIEMAIKQNSGGTLVLQAQSEMNSLTAVLVRSNTSSQPQRLTALPGTPYDGQEIYYQADSTNNIRFHLVWNAAISKWEVLGCSPLFSEVVTQENQASTTYSSASMTALTVTVNLAGVYIVETGFEVTNTTSAADAAMSYDIGATGAVDADASFLYTDTIAKGYSGSRQTLKTLVAGTTLTARYKVGAGTGTFRKRYIKVTPRLIG